MKKNKKIKNARKKFIEKQVRADNTTEFVIRETPTKTWWGKTIIIIILVGFVVIPVVALIVSMFK